MKHSRKFCYNQECTFSHRLVWGYKLIVLLNYSVYWIFLSTWRRLKFMLFNKISLLVIKCREKKTSLHQCCWYATVLPWQQEKAITARMSVSRLLDVNTILSASLFSSFFCVCFILFIDMTISWSVYTSAIPLINHSFHQAVYWST